jgi:hypothetical protein
MADWGSTGGTRYEMIDEKPWQGITRKTGKNFGLTFPRQIDKFSNDKGYKFLCFTQGGAMLRPLEF